MTVNLRTFDNDVIAIINRTLTTLSWAQRSVSDSALPGSYPPGEHTLNGSARAAPARPTDGTSSAATITSSDWANGPSSTETAAATLPYRNSISGSSQQLTVYVYATTVPVDPSKTVQSITFPNVSNTTSGGATSMHIWAVSLGTT